MTRDPETLWRALTPKPFTRSLIVGSVGTGKSTIGCSILESYHKFFPSHEIYIIDPKQRFFAKKKDKENTSTKIFPDGFIATNHGRRDGVAVYAQNLRFADELRSKKQKVFICQDPDECIGLFSWMFTNHDIRKRKMLCYLDESFDFVKNVRANPELRKLIQMGRELGIGMVIVNQRPSYIDATFISEANRLYIGTLHNSNDRKRLAETVAIPRAKELLVPMEKHTFWMINQNKPEGSFQFRLV